MANPALMPDWIHAALEAQLEGVSRKELAARAEAISLRYRAKDGSEGIRSELDALAYTLVRMPATYAAVRRALLEAAARCPEFQPRSLLDVGAGPGTASWAACETWPSLERGALVDQNQHLLAQAERIGDGASLALQRLNGSVPGALDGLAPAALVLASYALTELAERALAGVLERLWELASGALVLVEPGTPDGFARLLRCRAWLLAHGAHIVAPCTHGEACPMASAASREGGVRWCHFNQRLPRRREHLLVKSAQVNYEDERFCYLVATKFAPPESALRRVLSTPLVGKQEVRLSLCAPDAVEDRLIARKLKEAYKAARHFDWGDAVEL